MWLLRYTVYVGGTCTLNYTGRPCVHRCLHCILLLYNIISYIYTYCVYAFIKKRGVGGRAKLQFYVIVRVARSMVVLRMCIPSSGVSRFRPRVYVGRYIVTMLTPNDATEKISKRTSRINAVQCVLIYAPDVKGYGRVSG
jgi:hypothetical protein